MKPIFVVFIIPILDELVYPFVEKHVMAVTNLRKMVVALFMATLAFVMAGVLQVVIDANLQEKQMGGIDVSGYANISRLWQVPQYIAISVAEVMMLIPAMEWSYHEAPKSMKTVVNAAHNAYQALGKLLLSRALMLSSFSAQQKMSDIALCWSTSCNSAFITIFWN